MKVSTEDIPFVAEAHICDLSKMVKYLRVMIHLLLKIAFDVARQTCFLTANSLIRNFRHCSGQIIHD